MVLQRISKYVLLGIIFLHSTTALAGFATYSKNWPDDPEIVNEKITPIQSDDKTKAPALETNPCQSPSASVPPTPRVDEKDRLYVKFGAMFDTTHIGKINNLSSGALTGAYINQQTLTQNDLSWEFGVGSKGKWLRWEVEYMYTKDVNYNPQPVFAGRAENMDTGLVTNNAVWVNLFWDLNIPNFVYFTPYVGAMGGIVWNRTQTTLKNGVGINTAENTSQYGFGWGAVMGLRAKMWERWFLYFDYRYTNQGHVRWKDSTGIMNLKGTYYLQAITLGVQYLLG